MDLWTGAGFTLSIIFMIMWAVNYICQHISDENDRIHKIIIKNQYSTLSDVEIIHEVFLNQKKQFPRS